LNQVIEILENNGLVSEELVSRFAHQGPTKSVLRVQDAIHEALEASFEDVLERRLPPSESPFNFVASASMRGETTCQVWNCQVTRIAALARYSSLYCDRVFVPLSITTHSDNATVADERDALGKGIASILQLRPLVEAGIVILQPQLLHVCSECLRKQLPTYRAIQQATDQLRAENRKKFDVYYDPRHPKFVQIHGPDAYLEHPTMLLELWEEFDLLPKSKKGITKLTKAQVERSGLLEHTFLDMQKDILVQQYYGVHCGSKYLTDRAGEAEMLRKLAEDEQVELKAAVLCNQLTHTVPLLADLPLSTVVRVRKEDPEAFENYRVAIAQVIREHISKGKDVGKREAKEIYEDVLRPTVLGLQAKAKAVRNSALKKALVKTAATSAVLGLGVFGGLVPAQMLELLKALGPVKVFADLAEAYSSIEKNTAEVRSHNLYFLLRLKQEAEA
jgi:hypothetical protein